MTGAYLKVYRDGKWDAIEVEYLTNQEREELLETKDLMNWLYCVCDAIVKMEEAR